MSFNMFAFAGVVVLSMAVASPSNAQEGTNKVNGPLQFKAKSIDGKEVDLAKYRGKVVLIVNVASECGYTPQYKGLQALHAKYAKDGLAILGFPCNDFGKQEPGNEKQIKAFCEKNYGVQFDLFAKVAIVGDDAHPLFKFLTSKTTNPKYGGPVRWNFEKFLIGRDGSIIARFASDVDPESEEFEKALRQALAQK
ncbi:MAG: glutathione peroxidase [Gemmataceae bacterium]|nr:glutathione peroxidase [Gemmataceae bacterium]